MVIVGRRAPYSPGAVPELTDTFYCTTFLCTATISDARQKCKHCAAWVSQTGTDLVLYMDHNSASGINKISNEHDVKNFVQ